MSTGIEHRLVVRPFLQGDWLTYRPRCSCGWIGQRYGNRTNAQAEAATHALRAPVAPESHDHLLPGGFTP